MSDVIVDPVVADKAADAPLGKERLFRRREEGKEESPVTTIELFFDLVFVFAVTQLSHRLLSHMSPTGTLETLILFLATWWAWVYTSWATNWLDPERGKVRLMLMAVMLAGIAMSVAIPDAFGADGWLFVAAYLSIQIGRTAYLAWAFHGIKPSGARNFLRITAYFLLSAPLWIAGAMLDPDVRMLAWAAALAVEYAGPFLFFRFPGLGRSQGSDWDISGGHMAERCALFIIIALGESILVIGQTFVGLPRSVPISAALLTSFVSSAAMWWIYFDVGARRATELMEQSDQAGLLARNGYTFLHIPIVAGIIVTAVGDELLLAHPLDDAGSGFLLAAVGGPWLFLTATMCFKWYTWARSFPPLSHGVGASLLLALGVWATIAPLPPLAVGALATTCLLITASWEWFSLHGGWQRWWPGRPAG